MQIDNELISRLEKLARLQLSDTEKEQIKHDMTNILNMVEKLQEVDVDGVAPLVYVNEPTHRLRPDKIDHQVTREDALRDAPDQDGTYFRVPKVIDIK